MDCFLRFINNVNVDKMLLVTLCFCAAVTWTTCSVTCATTSVIDALENKNSATQLCNPPKTHSEPSTEI